MGKFNFWKTVGLAKPFDQLKKQVSDQIDTAIARIQDGSATFDIVSSLSHSLSDLVGKYTNPLAGNLIAMLLTNVDWTGMAKKPAADAIVALQKIRIEVNSWHL